MYFGITRRQLLQASLAGGILGALLLALFLGVGIGHGTVREPLDVLKVVGFSLLIGGGLPLFVGVAAILGIRIVGEQVEQVLCGRWVLRRRPVAELARAFYGGSLFPVVLSFRDGARIRLLGVPPHGPDLAQHLPSPLPGRVQGSPASGVVGSKRTAAERRWLQGTNPRRMLAALPSDKCNDRKLRLFASACYRRVLTADVRAATLLEISERFAEGLCSENDLEAAVALYLKDQPRPVFRLLLLVGAADPQDAADWAITGVLQQAADIKQEKKALCDLLRCVFGPLPFRPVNLASEWRTPTVLNLARVIYDERSFEDLPILGDALEEAGCTDADLLNHCRTPGPHARGCWVVDLLLNEGDAVTEAEWTSAAGKGSRWQNDSRTAPVTEADCDKATRCSTR
jgi:hypothetical protein